MWKAFWFTDADGRTSFGIGVGTLVLLANVDPARRLHLRLPFAPPLIGGYRDRLSGAPARLKAYHCVGCFNRRHMLFAWMSLCSVGFSDLYVRLCSMGIWTDWRIF